jgi:uncharacterized protein YkwD
MCQMRPGNLFGAAWMVFVLSLSAPAASTIPQPVSQDRPSGLAGKDVVRPTYEEIERGIVEAVNRERAARNLPALRVSADLTALAREHCREMAGQGRLVHESAAGLTYTERLEAAGILFAANGENVARGDSTNPEHIHDALMNSSGGHRDNILHPDFDEVGIGVARGADGIYYVTQDFIGSVVVRDEDAAAASVLAGLDEIRLSRGLPPFVADDDVRRTAQTFARIKSEGGTIPAVPSEYGEAEVDFCTGPDLDRLVAAMAEKPFDRFEIAGVGVRFARSSEHPGGAYHVCALLLVGNPALKLNEEERARTVLAVLNGIRAGQGRGPLRLDNGLVREAGELNRKYQRRKTELRLRDPNIMAVFYETPDLNRLAPTLYGRVSDRAFDRVGISAQPASAGQGPSVNFIVVLLLAR